MWFGLIQVESGVAKFFQEILFLARHASRAISNFNLIFVAINDIVWTHAHVVIDVGDKVLDHLELV